MCWLCLDADEVPATGVVYERDIRVIRAPGERPPPPLPPLCKGGKRCGERSGLVGSMISQAGEQLTAASADMRVRGSGRFNSSFRGPSGGTTWARPR